MCKPEVLISVKPSLFGGWAELVSLVLCHSLFFDTVNQQSLTSGIWSLILMMCTFITTKCLQIPLLNVPQSEYYHANPWKFLWMSRTE